MCKTLVRHFPFGCVLEARSDNNFSSPVRREGGGKIRSTQPMKHVGVRHQAYIITYGSIKPEVKVQLERSSDGTLSLVVRVRARRNQLRIGSSLNYIYLHVSTMSVRITPGCRNDIVAAACGPHIYR